MLSNFSSDCTVTILACLKLPINKEDVTYSPFIFELYNRTSETNRADVSKMAVDGCTGCALQHQL